MMNICSSIRKVAGLAFFAPERANRGEEGVYYILLINTFRSMQIFLNVFWFSVAIRVVLGFPSDTVKRYIVSPSFAKRKARWKAKMPYPEQSTPTYNNELIINCDFSSCGVIYIMIYH